MYKIIIAPVVNTFQENPDTDLTSGEFVVFSSEGLEEALKAYLKLYKEKQATTISIMSSDYENGSLGIFESENGSLSFIHLVETHKKDEEEKNVHAS